MPELPPSAIRDRFPECGLEAACCTTTVMPVRLLIRHHGVRPVGSIVASLQCGKCRATPRAVYLNETHNWNSAGERCLDGA